FVVEHDIDFLAITEAWLQSDISNQITVNNICPTGFLIHHVPRAGARGGGVALLHKSQFKLTRLSVDANYTSFEFTDCIITHSSTRLRMIVVYRTPPSKKNRFTVSKFLDEFSSFLENVATTIYPLIIAGDFNFHLDNSNDRSAARFQELMDTFNLSQHVQQPTHKNGHTLDLVITRLAETSVRNVMVTDLSISDHCAVHWTSPCLVKPSPVRKEISYRKLKSLNREAFMEDIMVSPLFSKDYTNTEELSNCYNNVLTKLLHKHAPI
ncbi:predicted protein, partial [Nematostella vectensis]